MSSQQNRRLEPSPEQRAPGSRQDPSSRLPRPLQEHLAQKLRSTYQELGDKPAFLGDPAIPVEFEHHLARLEAAERARHVEKVHNQAVEAVKTALEDIVARPLDADGTPPDDQGSSRNG